MGADPMDGTRGGRTAVDLQLRGRACRLELDGLNEVAPSDAIRASRIYFVTTHW
jgi:hypothetical protein